ncbi:MAG: GIY-YIG nuclease family protein [Candidatus Omnitrophica bacterium]|nr:GIY-YIG nuclease family protein [Candidatus Omnitrophota bacterium]
MYIVYILTSKKFPRRYYIGLTQDLDKRLKEHDSESSIYAKRYAPWQIETYLTFKKKNLAKEFEKYLKSGSGFVFLKKRLI